ncbi:MAG: hypothetical protein D3911_13545 [Candidatus Electrothrix sp. AW3_4]|nr:hypothetical protein [Candidatus Electrothrix gigas]
MSDIIIYAVYAIFYKVAVIGAGFGCIVMGYRLFVLGVMPKKGSEIDAQSGEIRLSVKNAAPGTCFTALGTLMIVVMLVQDSPELKTVSEKSTQIIEDAGSDSGSIPPENSEKKASETVIQKDIVIMRSGSEDVFTAIELGKQFEQSDQFDKAIEIYSEPLKNGKLSLKNAADALRAIAAVRLKQGRYDEASAFAWLADQSEPENAEGLALIAKIEFHRGNYALADEKISQAAYIDSAFAIERDELKDKIRDQQP